MTPASHVTGGASIVERNCAVSLFTVAVDNTGDGTSQAVAAQGGKNLYSPIFLLLALAACSDKPCPNDAAGKAGTLYAQCIGGDIEGRGGLGCGQVAYDAFCRAGGAQ